MRIRGFFVTISLIVGPLAWLAPAGAVGAASARLCRHARGQAACLAVIRSDPTGHPLALSTAQGYTPSQFRAAYRSTGNHAIVAAIVVAYHNPSLVSDVAAFSRVMALSAAPACTSTRQMSCLDVRNQLGAKSYPATDSGWELEEALDVETLHGQCPGCRIEVVEASSPAMADLMAADDQAVALGAQVISNSWGGSELKGQSRWDAHFKVTGVTFLFSSGDNGYHVSYPAASPAVVAVGGTTLVMGPGGSWQNETAWKGSGSGCSRYEPKPTWQRDAGCPGRTVADVSADADPATGAAVYHSGSWYTVGGTSLAAPLVAGMMAAGSVVAPAALYRSAGFRDVVDGNTASCASYLCRSVRGYDGPTGLGSPVASVLFGR